ncbi:MAG: NPCBM/NEW2 domain-containing protein [Pirellulales bacterium]
MRTIITSIVRSCSVAMILLGATAAWAATPDAIQRRDQWLNSRLLEYRLIPAPEVPPPAASLLVLANHDPVWRNGRGPKPMKMGRTEYVRGLYCHATSKVVVHLPSPGKEFSALVGVDTNDQTSNGRGSVVFSVTVKEKVAFKTGVMREGVPPQPVKVDLAGADTFTLDVGDAGDGISCDQSDWADALVTLADGRQLWLGDLPLAGPLPPPRSTSLAFSFVYGGRPFDAQAASWTRKTETSQLDPNRRRHTLVWADAKTGLEVRCVAVSYADFPALEWTVYFKNTGKENTPILENIQGLDARIERGTQGEFLLKYNKGDTCAPDLYQPLEQALAPGATLRLAPSGGRGTNGAFPYYNLAMPGQRLLLAVGWPGQWATSFVRDNGRGLRIVAGQELTRLVLRPGEEVRSPLIAILFCDGEDPLRAQNLWRRWMWAHNVPRTSDGRLPPPIMPGNTSLEFNEMIDANEANQKAFIDRYVEERVKIDHWWMDAGWYPCQGWPQTGTWEPDLKRFPAGLRAISDHARAKGIKTLVWFEPERVAGGTWLSKNHPEWLLGGTLLNLGDPAARAWLTDHVDRVLREQGIDLYRQDFNMDPLDFWRRNDAPDRQGMTENLHVQGYLAYWDALRRRHPKLVIDSCASGGRRNDLETMRRAVALHPTDYNYGDLAAKQAFHQSLFSWLPYFGSNTVPVDTVTAYAFRSGHALSMVLGYDLRRNDLDYPLLRKLSDEAHLVRPYYFGDYYPLTPYSLGEENWIAWQFHRPGEEDGLIEAFRRPKNEESTRTLRLAGLDLAAQYEVTDLDVQKPQRMSGRELLERGLPVTIPAKPGAAVILYKKVKSR